MNELLSLVKGFQITLQHHPLYEPCLPQILIDFVPEAHDKKQLIIEQHYKRFDKVFQAAWMYELLLNNAFLVKELMKKLKEDHQHQILLHYFPDEELLDHFLYMDSKNILILPNGMKRYEEALSKLLYSYELKVERKFKSFKYLHSLVKFKSRHAMERCYAFRHYVGNSPSQLTIRIEDYVFN